MFIALVGKGDFGSEGNGLDKGGKIASQKRMRRSSGDHYVLRKIKMYFKAHISFLAIVCGFFMATSPFEISQTDADPLKRAANAVTV
jgi:hypothetical protein